MSIYVGGEKAKLYRGDYGPAQFYKGGVKIAGYTNVEKVGTSISGVDTYNDALNLTIEGKSEQTMTANSPSPDYPEPIRSSENFDVISCGRNLFDKRIYNGIVTYTADGFTYTNKEMYRIHSTPIPIDFKPNTQYTMSCDAKDSASTRNCIINAIFTDGTYQYLSIINSDVLTHYSKTTFPNRTVKSLNISYAELATPTVITINNFQIVEGTVDTPYEPYHAATTAHVTDPLRSVGNVSDSIEVSNGKVEVVRRVVRTSITSSGNIKEHTFRYHNGYTHFSYNTSLGLLNPTICNVLSHTAYSWAVPVECISVENTSKVIYPTFSNVSLGISDTDTPEQKVSKLKAWLETHEMYADCALYNPTRTDITATPLGQALLAMRTYPHYTQVYTNATLPPTLRARIKEMVL